MEVSSIQTPKRFSFIIVFLAILILLSFSYIAYLTYQNTMLRKQLAWSANEAKSISDLSYEDLYLKIKKMGPINNAITGSTDHWPIRSESLSRETLNYTYQYPIHLFAVPNIRKNDANTVYFFENKAAYQRFLTCTKDRIFLQGNEVSKDWEAACDMEGDLLFTITASLLGSNLNYTKVSDLVSYSGPSLIMGKPEWVLPKKGAPLPGLNGINMWAKTNEGSGGTAIYFYLSYKDKNPPVPETMKRLTTMDMDTLFLHILSTFKFTN